ncbi:hypothetical protein EV702DRAFT_95053 [Suillus placidus]|uniref:Uncharacterized protein n=1 Tax=Suillus placidus TaxID=48579 RepID=A0A9P7A017_9AGAM|nr:hypothetical protein EV702DRAFT_95053 [Suillus placidus]
MIYALSSLHSLIVMDATERQQLVTHSYVILMANSILIYDHLTTLTEESFSFGVVRKHCLRCHFLSIAMPRCSAISMAYLLISCPFQISCSKYMVTRQLLIFFQQFIVCVILIIRTYALYNCSKRLLTWITIIFVVLAGSASVGTFGQYARNLTTSPGVGCFETYTVEESARFGLAWLAILGFELLIFVLTVHRTCKTRGLLRLRLVTRRNIFDVMFHDGAMYFGAMTLCNIPNIAMYYYEPGVINGSLGLAILTSCMSVTLISRLMLNLHKSIDSGIFSVPARDDDHCLSVLTTRINVQSAIA